ncbi:MULTISPECIES: DUF5079 family protein [Staphylococcus]|uniref:DUF5079 family protein n=1 Tax=Staphylococcus TaxID=1279 RepID=UPI00076B5518|nr:MULTISPECIES: DUF5079 family protein [Staphylococcus]AMG64950.1 DUF5079 domain-containing protein [Staphylococcus lugdunensis]ARB78263.1 DUF5079 domain-containing protein [Staphylococcus lugdunensis]ARJ19385.1 DUF5079 domain-containing protein [Staphylococcus lugdunensis]MBM7133044.1 DUF5079 family protein [Staphylococcus lugdunensis]MCH8641437.1 DUF5079 family protein [Staphylococcus lugdunensis]
MEETYQALRKPATQAMNMLALGSILFSSIQYFVGLTLAATANYLIIATSIELLIIFCGLLQLFFPKIPSDRKKIKKRALIFMIVGILSTYSSYLSFYNIYFFIEGNTQEIRIYWILGTVIAIICFSAHILSLIFMTITPSFIKDKTLLILFLKFVAILLYVQKAIEFFIIPDHQGNRFLMIGLLLLIPLMNYICTYFYLLFGEILTSKEMGYRIENK